MRLAAALAAASDDGSTVAPPPPANPDEVPAAQEPGGPPPQIRPPRHVGADGLLAALDQLPTMQQRLDTAAWREHPATAEVPIATIPVAPAAIQTMADRWLARPEAPAGLGDGGRRRGLNPFLVAATIAALISAGGLFVVLRHLPSGEGGPVVVADAGASSPAAEPAAAAPEALPVVAAAAGTGKAILDRVPEAGVRQIDTAAPAAVPAEPVTVVQRGTLPAAGRAVAAAAPPHPVRAPQRTAASELAAEAASAASSDITPGSGFDRSVSAYAPVPATIDPHAALTATSPATVVRDVNMRAGPDNGAASVRVLRAGTRVAVVDCGYWCEIVVEGRRGYVFNSFLDGALPAGAPGR